MPIAKPTMLISEYPFCLTMFRHAILKKFFIIMVGFIQFLNFQQDWQWQP